MLKMSPSTALLPGAVSDRCWNSRLLQAVLEWRALGLPPSTSLLPLVMTVACWEGREEVARSRAPSCPLWRLTGFNRLLEHNC